MTIRDWIDEENPEFVAKQGELVLRGKAYEVPEPKLYSTVEPVNNHWENWPNGGTYSRSCGSEFAQHRCHWAQSTL